MSERDQVLEQAAEWLAAGRGVALATVVGTWGSSPRPPGSLLAAADDGAFVGSVSGGCIEGAVVREALDVIAEGGVKLMDFGVTDESAWQAGLACGGEMRVLLEKADKPDLLRTLVTDRPVALATHLDSGHSALVSEAGASGDLALDDDALAQVRRALHEDRGTTLETEAGAVWVNVFNPPLRLFVIGAVHVAQTLAPMATLAGFRVTVVDPRRAFATEQRFPGVTLATAWPDEVLTDLDSRSAVVTLVHDPKVDDVALEAAMRSPAFYIGALGSRRTHARRLDRLRARGFADADLARIRGPVGLDLGGRKAPEIAVAILAQAVAARYGREPG